jgi:uncharacterized protein DUF6459
MPRAATAQLTHQPAQHPHRRTDRGPRPHRHVTVLPAPRREPPFDDELAAAGIVALGHLDRQLPFPQPVERPPLRLAPRSADVPDPVPWARRMMVGVAEAAAGRRPIQQLVGMLSPSILAALRTDFAQAQRRRTTHWMTAATVRTVTGCEPAPGVAELCATLRTPGRTRAVALRAELQHGVWRCVRLQIG